MMNIAKAWAAPMGLDRPLTIWEPGVDVAGDDYDTLKYGDTFDAAEILRKQGLEKGYYVTHDAPYELTLDEAMAIAKFLCVTNIEIHDVQGQLLDTFVVSQQNKG